MSDETKPEIDPKILKRRAAVNAWRAANKDKVKQYNKQYHDRVKSGYYDNAD